MRRKSILVLVIIALLSIAVSIRAGVIPGFQGLGDLSGRSFYSIGMAISSDGSVAAGFSESSGGIEAFRWTKAEGIRPLGDLPGGNFFSYAHSVSGDGSVIVGFSDSGAEEAFIWTQSNGLTGLGFPPGATSSIAYGVSSDGSIIVGSSNYQVFRYITTLNKMELLGINAISVDVSDDGYVVVGVTQNDEAFRWTKTGGLQKLGYLDGDTLSFALSASYDGSAIVGGSGNPPSRTEAFRWTQSTGMVGLGDLPGGTFFSMANAVSDDGTIIVGGSDTGLGGGLREAFIWDEHRGMRSLKSVLEDDCGLDLTGWILYDAMGISADGLTIVGHGRNPYGQQEAWIATIPEPSTLLLIGLGGVGLLRKRRERIFHIQKETSVK